eukprot:PhM_4_TR8849/c0_g1_i1/m.55979
MAHVEGVFVPFEVLSFRGRHLVGSLDKIVRKAHLELDTVGARRTSVNVASDDALQMKLWDMTNHIDESVAYLEMLDGMVAEAEKDPDKRLQAHKLRQQMRAAIVRARNIGDTMFHKLCTGKSH